MMNEMNCSDMTDNYSSQTESNQSEIVSLLTDNYEDVNMRDENGNTPLHHAVSQDSLEYLNYLLQKPNIQLDIKNNKCETPLLMSLGLKRSSSFVMQIIEAGADITIENEIGETPLHKAIAVSATDIGQELIKRGVNIDAQDEEKCTPLHVAIKYRNLEAACMLLCCGTDVNICCKSNNTPLIQALGANLPDIAETLIDYYCDYSCVNIYDLKALNLALAYKSPLALRLVEADDDINFHPNNSAMNIPITNACMYESADLFKLMWPKFDWRIYRPNESSFLLMYLRFCNFSTREWLECLYLILESTASHDLISYYTDEMESNPNSPDIFLFYQLLNNFKYRKIDFNDRITIIWLFLYLGAKVALSDINIAYELFGFNEELEALIACYDSLEEVKIEHLYNNFNFPLPTCIIALEDYNTKTMLKLFENQIRYYKNHLLYAGFELTRDHISFKEIIYLLGFFSASYPVKQNIIHILKMHSVLHVAVSNCLEKLPEVPSLMELSRNKVRTFIRKTYEVKYPYQFHDAVKRLIIPKHIKNIIRFKTPLY